LILIFGVLESVRKQDQKIAAFGSSYSYGAGIKKPGTIAGAGLF